MKPDGKIIVLGLTVKGVISSRFRYLCTALDPILISLNISPGEIHWQVI